MKLQIPPGPFEGYIFDCDGTLADTMSLHYQAWNEELEEHGCHFDLQLFYQLAGTPTEKITEILNQKHGLKMNPKTVAHSKEERFYKLLPQVKPIPSVIEQVKLHYGKVPISVASGGFREAVTKTLQVIDALKYFEIIVGSEDYTHGKPAPDPFLEAAKRMGVRPEKCLVFEDSDIGIQAAVAAGMKWVKVEL